MLTLCHNYFGVSQNKSCKDGTQPFSKRKYVFGLFILCLVAVLWVASSEVTKYIYTEKKLDRPFLVTYIRSSLLFVYLLVLCFTPPTKDPCQPADYTQLLEATAETDDDSFCNENNTSLVSYIRRFRSPVPLVQGSPQRQTAVHIRTADPLYADRKNISPAVFLLRLIEVNTDEHLQDLMSIVCTNSTPNFRQIINNKNDTVFY